MVSGAVRVPPTTSTTSTSSGGLSQCRPAKRSGCFSPSASESSGSDEVFVVRIASGAATCSASARTARFGSTASPIVSTTRVTPASASSAEVVSSTGWRPSRGRAASRLVARRAQSRTDAAGLGEHARDSGAHRARADNSDLPRQIHARQINVASKQGSGDRLPPAPGPCRVPEVVKIARLSAAAARSGCRAAATSSRPDTSPWPPRRRPSRR